GRKFPTTMPSSRSDPRGAVLARLSGSAGLKGDTISMVPKAASRFPQQTSGFVFEAGQLYQIVLTPVYVDSSSGAGLLNVLVAGYVVDSALAEKLKSSTGGSEFIFVSGGQVIASTLQASPAGVLSNAAKELTHVELQGADYLQFSTP